MKRYIILIFTIMIVIASMLLISCGECEHTFGEWEIIKDATCTEKGTQSHTCTKCGHTELNDIEALGHKEAIKEKVEPTCTESGLTEGKYCKVCNEIITKQVKINATGHKEVVDKAVEPTCSSIGLTEGKHCSVCNEKTVKQTEIPKLEHTYGDWVKNTDGTCTTKGTEKRTCSVCNYSDIRDLDYVSHVYGEWIDAIAPTETNDGTAGHYHCSVCGKDFNKNGVQLKSLVLPKEAKGLEVEFNSGNTCTILGIGTYTNPDSQLYIPYSINGSIVTKIADYAFKNCTDITFVRVDSGVTLIGKSAFEGCSNLESAYMVGVITVDSAAFKGCTRLNEVEFGVIEYIKDEAFMNCSSLAYLYLSEFLKTIGNKAFMGCDNISTPRTTGANSHSVFLPDTVTTVGDYAFSECENLKSIVMWETNITSVGKGVFANCPKFSSVSGFLNKISKIPDEMFMNCDSIVILGMLGNNITSIGTKAFMDCDNLESFYITDKITSIGSEAFKDCEKLKTVYDLSSSINIQKGSMENGYIGYYADNIFTTLG